MAVCVDLVRSNSLLSSLLARCHTDDFDPCPEFVLNLNPAGELGLADPIARPLDLREPDSMFHGMVHEEIRWLDAEVGPKASKEATFILPKQPLEFGYLLWMISISVLLDQRKRPVVSVEVNRSEPFVEMKGWLTKGETKVALVEDFWVGLRPLTG